MKTKEEIIPVEKSPWNAIGYPEYFRALMTDRAITVIEPMGFISKEQVIEMSAKAETWTDLRMERIKLVELAPDCMAIAYLGEAKGSGFEKLCRASQLELAANSALVRKKSRPDRSEPASP